MQFKLTQVGDEVSNRVSLELENNANVREAPELPLDAVNEVLVPLLTTVVDV